MYSESERNILLRVAEASIRHGVEMGEPLDPDLALYESSLQAERATFVTLERGGQLRGCIGTLEAYRPLVIDVARNAYAAAFRDPRFQPLQRSELEGLSLQISVLSLPEPMQFDSEADLLGQIRPDIDGLILEAAGRRGTFLPSVWESLPTPEQFLSHLKLKAGLATDYWSDEVQVSRYTTESFGRTLPT